MSYLLLLVLVGCVAVPLLRALRAPEGILEYPFVAGMAWLTFLVPQVMGVIENPLQLPEAALRDGGVELTLTMFILCAGLGIAGYSLPLGDHWFRHEPVHIDAGRLFAAGCAFLALALFGYHGLAQMAGGYIRLFSLQGSYQLIWQGEAVTYNFFAQLVYPGLICCLMGLSRSPSKLKWVVVGLGSVFPLATIIFLGRRAQAARYLLICFGVLYFTRRWSPPQWLSIPAAMLVAIGVIVAPKYRVYSPIGGDWSEIQDINVVGSVEDVLRGHRNQEFVAAVVLTSAYQVEGDFGYGRGIYNQTIKNFVPSMAIGRAAKETLYLPMADADEITSKHYGWKREMGTVVTGACDAFKEFWFAGALLFFFIGWAFRILWRRAARDRSTIAQMAYLAMLVHAALTVTGNITSFTWSVLWTVVYFFPVVVFARTAPVRSVVPLRSERARRDPDSLRVDPAGHGKASTPGPE